jgi:hypothetical protein
MTLSLIIDMNMPDVIFARFSSLGALPGVLSPAFADYETCPDPRCEKAGFHARLGR